MISLLLSEDAEDEQKEHCKDEETYREENIDPNFPIPCISVAEKE